MVCFFIPSLGLFNILYHHKAEEKPYLIDGLNETALWRDLDRWDYSSNNPEGTPPHYSEYTGLSLKWTFILYLVLAGAQLLTTLLVKIFTSKTFVKGKNFLCKFLHLLHSLNLAFPYEDWDQGRFSVQEYRERHRQTNIEMAWSLCVNILFSLVMTAPLWYTGKETEPKV